MRIAVARIQEALASDFGIPKEALSDRGNRCEFSHPRQYAMLLARELTPLSFPSLGRIFHRDHSTIISGARSARKRIANDRNLALKIEARKLLLQCEPRPIFDWAV